MTHGDDSAYPYGQTIRGFTKREYIATAILQGLMANPQRYKYVTANLETGVWSHEDATQHNAEKAVYLADALIAALNKEAK